MQSTAIHARVRDEKSKVNKLRREGYIPAVIYGHNKDTALLQVESKELDKVLKLFGKSGLVDLDIEEGANSEKKTVFIKDVQRDHVHDRIIHLDLQEVSMNEKTKLTIPVAVLGEENRHKDMGVVQHFLREIHVNCLPGDLPAKIMLDATGLKPGDSIKVSDLNLGEKVLIDTPLDEVIISVSHPHSIDEDENEPNQQHPMEATSPAVVVKGEDA